MFNLVTIIVAFIIFGFGIVIGYSTHKVLLDAHSYAGIMKIVRDDDTLIYSLELHEDPMLLEFVPEVTFKVETSDQSSIRK